MDKCRVNFNWDKLLNKYVNGIIGLRIQPEECSNSIINSTIESHATFRKNNPIFDIDPDMHTLLSDIGHSYCDLKANKDILKLIKLPYPSMVIQFTYYDTALKEKLFFSVLITENNDTWQDWSRNDWRKLDNRVERNVTYQHDKLCCIFLICGKESSSTPWVTVNNEISGVVLEELPDDIICENLVFGYSSELEANILCCIVGLCIALNTKQLFNEQNIASDSSIWLKNNQPCIIEEHGYKKLTLSLKGKQHLEYIREKQSGTKSKSRLHLRRGHFKQRKTGLFWWNPHIAGKENEYAIEKSYVIKE